MLEFFSKFLRHNRFKYVRTNFQNFDTPPANFGKTFMVPETSKICFFLCSHIFYFVRTVFIDLRTEMHWSIVRFESIFHYYVLLKGKNWRTADLDSRNDLNF